MNVDPDENYEYCTFIEACNYRKRKHKENCPYMNLSCEFICNMQKELKKWYHENYYLFVQGNGIQDRVNVKKKLISTFIENPRTSQ